MRWVLWLYPQDWRDRYSGELEAMLEDFRPSPFSVVDLLRGAFDAWRHPIAAREPGRPGRWTVDLTIRRLAGLVFLLGAACSALYVFNPGGGIVAGAPCPAPAGASPPCAAAALPVPDFLALMFGLLLAAFSALWLFARLTGQASRAGEVSLLVAIVAYLVLVRDSGVLPQVGPWPAGQDLGILGLLVLLPSMILQAGVAINKGLLPLWSLLPLAAAPILGLLPLGIGPSAGLLSLGATWLMIGLLLLMAPPNARRPLGTIHRP